MYALDGFQLLGWVVAGVLFLVLLMTDKTIKLKDQTIADLNYRLNNRKKQQYELTCSIKCQEANLQRMKIRLNEIENAVTKQQGSGQSSEDHFSQLDKMVDIGSGQRGFTAHGKPVE